MNILIVTDLDNGGQMIALRRALNKYTDHTARLITYKQSYLRYETDIVNPNINQVKEWAEWADFYIMGEMSQPRPISMVIYDKMMTHNSIIRSGGSMARTKPARYNTGKFGYIVKTGGYHDFSIYCKIGLMGSTVNMYDFENWPKENKPSNDKPVRLVFSGTATKMLDEHSGAYKEAWKRLKKMYSPSEVEFVAIAGESWETSLKIKSTCNICFDQLLLGMYASSAIEGMYYHMPTFCYVNGWCRSLLPDVPVITHQSVEDIVIATSELIENPKQRQNLGNRSHDYVVKTHSAKHAIVRWVALIEFVQGLKPSK